MRKRYSSIIKNFFKDIVNAVAGADVDFTGIGLGRSIFLLAIPMVLEMVMESVFAIVDIYFVSKIGADAVAAVGITESLMTLVYAVAVGLSAAGTAMVARRIGEKKPKEASRSAMQVIFVCIAVSFIIAVPGIFMAKHLLQLMGAAPGAIEAGHMYTAIILGSNIIILLLFVINAIFRGAGDAAISMRVLWVANIINIILDPILIFGWGPIPAMGVKGAAIATCAGRGVGVIIQLVILLRGNARVKLFWNQLKIDFTLIKQVLNISSGGIMQMIVATSSWIFMVRIIALFGSEVVAGYTVALRIVMFALLPSWGLSNAAATLVGQNLGAGQPDRAERSVWITGFTNVAVLSFFGLMLFLFADGFIRFLVDDPAVVKHGAIALKYFSGGFLFYGLGVVVVQAFNGAGDTRTPTWINFVCFWLISIPLAWTLAKPLGMSEVGVYLAVIISESCLSIISSLVFKRGRWKHQQV